MQTWLEGPEAAGFFRVTRWVIDAEAWRQRLGFNGSAQNTNSEVIAETFESAGALSSITEDGTGNRPPPPRGAA